jgi:hypothetical protein
VYPRARRGTPLGWEPGSPSGNEHDDVNLDHVDLPSVIRVIRGWPQADRYPPLELRRVEIARDAYGRLGEVIRQLAPEAREVLIVQDDTPMCRGRRSQAYGGRGAHRRRL